MGNKGSFRKGPDPRRHELTFEERQRGGLRAWYGIMAEVRLSMNLPLPLPQVRQIAAMMLKMRQKDSTDSSGSQTADKIRRKK